MVIQQTNSLFVWLVADGWCWFVLREKYCWLVPDGWFVLREKYCWLVADKPSEQADNNVTMFFWDVMYRCSIIMHFGSLNTILIQAV
jgi:hypothetical protein